MISMLLGEKDTATKMETGTKEDEKNERTCLVICGDSEATITDTKR